MSENKEAQTSDSGSFMHWEDWLVLLTGGLVTSGAVGWCVYKGFKSQKFDSKAIMTIVASFAGGMGVYFTGSALVYMCEKSSNGQEKSTPQKYASNLTADDSEISLCERFANVVNELDRRFAFEALKARECNDLNKKVMNSREAFEVPFESKHSTKRPNELNRKVPKNRLKLRIDNQMETCYSEDMGSRKAKFREEILSYINELKGYVQGAIDPLPMARSIQSTEMNDEMRRRVVMIVKEYANSMLPKLEQVIDEFVDSVCKAMQALDYANEHKVKKAFETLGFPEKGLSAETLKTEMNQYYNTLENATKNKPHVPSCQSGQPKSALGVNIQPAEPVSNLHENISKKTSELSLPLMPKFAKLTPASTHFMSKEENKSGQPEVENLKNPLPKPPVKVFLNQEQINALNMLKSEL